MTEKIVSLNISELIVTAEPVVVSTVLGSCVSICLYSPESRCGGMIHFALPEMPDGSDDEPLRYGNYAIPKLIDELENLTGRPAARFVAKIIGGANNIGSEKAHNNIGNANVEIACKILRDLGIKIIAKDVGGAVGRKALFHVTTGRLQSALVGPGHTRPSAEKAVGQNSTINSPRVTFPNAFATERKTRVLIVDDSKTIRELLSRILKQDPEIEVVGQAEDPFQAEAQLIQCKPDVITLDVHMPGMTGVQWLEKLLPGRPIPVVMITSLQLQDGNEVFRALELGAVDYIQKPALSELGEVGPIIRDKVRAAAKAKVRPRSLYSQKNVFLNKSVQFKHGLILAIGASTGGTEALREVLIRLPSNIPPMVIVQHIPPVFSKAFADRLNTLCPFEVKEAQNGDAVHEDRVLIAPGGMQMKVVKKTSGLFVEVNNEPPVNRHRPSVDYLFNSVASLFGKKAIGVILTGMGVDGAKGLLNMKISGARTLSQNESSCVVYGMPKAAWEMGASEEAVSLEQIASKIVELGVLKKVA